LYEGFKRGHPRTGELSVGYAIRTLRSVATDHFRKESRARHALKEVAILLAGKSVGDPAKRITDRALVVWYLRELPMRQQEAYILAKYGGYTAAETSEYLGLAKGTVSNYISAAQKRMEQLHFKKGK
jgi:DNA-directed RNA polymerase specialized sigma24 family protein